MSYGRSNKVGGAALSLRAYLRSVVTQSECARRSTREEARDVRGELLLVAASTVGGTPPAPEAAPTDENESNVDDGSVYPRQTSDLVSSVRVKAVCKRFSRNRFAFWNSTDMPAAENRGRNGHMLVWEQPGLDDSDRPQQLNRHGTSLKNLANYSSGKTIVFSFIPALFCFFGFFLIRSLMS